MFFTDEKLLELANDWDADYFTRISGTSGILGKWTITKNNKTYEVEFFEGGIFKDEDDYFCLKQYGSSDSLFYYSIKYYNRGVPDEPVHFLQFHIDGLENMYSGSPRYISPSYML